MLAAAVAEHSRGCRRFSSLTTATADSASPAKSFALADRVLRHALVVVEVIAGEIGEGGSGEFDPGRPTLVEGVAGDFDGAGAGIRVAHLGEQAGDVGGRGRGHVGFAAVFSVVDFDRPDHSAAHADGGENVADEVGGGCFAVGAGHAQNADLAMREAVKGVGEQGGGAVDVADGNLGERAIV